ncbi:MAG: response regulator [Candidatus Omnitrophota bacterium]|nr:response regulator [Candidatus Omnitrophota bacterium]
MPKRKVMIVDDDGAFVDIIKDNMEETGKYEVLAMTNAKEIVKDVHNFKPDLILLDLLMPGVGGLDACQMLNEDEIGRKVPIIILSALDKDADKLKAFKLGVVDYAEKPIDQDELFVKIERALEFK